MRNFLTLAMIGVVGFAGAPSPSSRIQSTTRPTTQVNTPEKNGFHCKSCGHWHEGLPMDVRFSEPVQIGDVEDGKYPDGVVADGDFRVVRHEDGRTDYFIRGLIELPVRGSDENFAYGVWASLSEASMREARAADAANEAAGPFFGWLCNRLSGYPDTLNLKTHVHVLPDRVARLELEPTDHPLSIEQREGITRDRLIEIVRPVLHPPTSREAPEDAERK